MNLPDDADRDGQLDSAPQQPPQPPKRKGGRKPIYATSEERKQRNRQAQAAFRKRRTEYTKSLEATIKRHEDDLSSLRQSNWQALEEECLVLRYKNSFLQRILSHYMATFSEEESFQLRRLPSSQRAALLLWWPDIPELRNAEGGITKLRNAEEGQTEWEIPGLIGGIPISAKPDTGSYMDVLSERFVKRHQIRVTDRGKCRIQLPNKKQIRLLGTVTLPFSFEGEETVYSRCFHVVRNAIHDVTLGGPFLTATKTLKDFQSRIKTKTRKLSSWVKRLCFLGKPREFVRGTLNSHAVQAVPDTGSDVTVMSREMAQRLGLSVETKDEFRSQLEFIDGSQAFTDGMVFGAKWGFGTDEQSTFECDVHVVNSLACDLILGNEFLFKTEAYSQFSDHFYELEVAESEQNAGIAILYMIKQKQGKVFLDMLKTLLGRSRTAGVVRLAPTIYEELEAEMARHGKTADEISGLSPSAYQAAWEAELLRHEEWIRDWNRRKSLLNVQSQNGPTLTLNVTSPHLNDQIPAPNESATRSSLGGGGRIKIRFLAWRKLTRQSGAESSV